MELNTISSKCFNMLDLPDEALMHIFEYLSFEEIANFRIICKRINEVNKEILNSGFKKACNASAMAFKKIKSLLPRRESERRRNPLVKHADVLSSIDTRLSMLSMTYTKYIDLNLCCFIPGKVLDEIFRILGLTMESNSTLRPLEMLQEFRDISSMAIEHFDENIASELKKCIENNSKVQCSMSEPHSELFLVRKCIRSNMLTPLASINIPKKLETVHYSPSDDSVECSPQTNEEILQIKRLEKRVSLLQRRNKLQRRNFESEIQRINRHFDKIKRRLDEMDSKQKELLAQSVQQYKSEPAQTESNNVKSEVNDAITETEIKKEICQLKEEELQLRLEIDNNSGSDCNESTTASISSQKRRWTTSDGRDDVKKRKKICN